jgi:hypothetical protein
LLKERFIKYELAYFSSLIISPGALKIILEVQFSDTGKITSDLFVDNYQVQIVYQDPEIHVNLSNHDGLEMVAGLSKALVINTNFEMTNGLIHETNGMPTV